MPEVPDHAPQDQDAELPEEDTLTFAFWLLELAEIVVDPLPPTGIEIYDGLAEIEPVGVAGEEETGTVGTISVGEAGMSVGEAAIGFCVATGFCVGVTTGVGVGVSTGA